MISGVFSVTTQAVGLGLFPRVRVKHSSAEYAGQIYVPVMNWIMMLATIGLVLSFGSSAALAGAYGLAVSGAMTIVTPLTLSLIKSRTGAKSRWLRAGLCRPGRGAEPRSWHACCASKSRCVTFWWT
ncbi:MAG: KUP/HAK/KT family potassium transporter [Steroidobacteraceae bacterium]